MEAEFKGRDWLRPKKFRFEFISVPKQRGSTVTWKNLEIRETDHMGYGLFIKRMSAGTLIPMGGKRITRRQAQEICKHPDRHSVEYLIDCANEYVYSRSTNSQLYRLPTLVLSSFAYDPGQ